MTLAYLPTLPTHLHAAAALYTVPTIAENIVVESSDRFGITTRMDTSGCSESLVHVRDFSLHRLALVWELAAFLAHGTAA